MPKPKKIQITDLPGDERYVMSNSQLKESAINYV